MPADLTTLTPLQALGIPVALVGAIFLALGAQLQHRGVSKVNEGRRSSSRNGLSIHQLTLLLRRPSWLLGTLMLGIAVVLQLLSLFLAPLTVVQPLGAVALVVTAVLNARVSKRKLSKATIRAITFCVGGVGLFVGTAALTTSSSPVTVDQLEAVLVTLVVVVATIAAIFILFRKQLWAIFYILAAGVLFGFVATLAKVVIDRVHGLSVSNIGAVASDVLTVLCVVGLIGAAIFGSYFVQTAYSKGPPDLVVAGLTVIDPIVGVTIGIVILREASSAPPWAFFIFVLAGALGAYGVYDLAKRSDHQR